MRLAVAIVLGAFLALLPTIASGHDEQIAHRCGSVVGGARVSGRISARNTSCSVATHVVRRWLAHGATDAPMKVHGHKWECSSVVGPGGSNYSQKAECLRDVAAHGDLNFSYRPEAGVPY